MLMYLVLVLLISVATVRVAAKQTNISISGLYEIFEILNKAFGLRLGCTHTFALKLVRSVN
jgi:hypothetical protein